MHGPAAGRWPVRDAITGTGSSTDGIVWICALFRHWRPQSHPKCSGNRLKPGRSLMWRPIVDQLRLAQSTDLPRASLSATTIRGPQRPPTAAAIDSRWPRSTGLRMDKRTRGRDRRPSPLLRCPDCISVPSSTTGSSTPKSGSEHWEIICEPSMPACCRRAARCAGRLEGVGEGGTI